jgi:hypothetical protein
MADKKYIKKMEMPGYTGENALNIKDAEAVSSINGYSNEQINAGTVTFADTRITKDELNRLFTTESN